MAKAQSAPRIESREFIIEVLTAKAIHQFLVMYKSDGTMVELHGVAVDGEGIFKEVSTFGDTLKVAAHPPIPHHEKLTVPGFNGMYYYGQEGRILVEGTEEEVQAHWDAALQAAEMINDKDAWGYSVDGGRSDDHYNGNSNSVAATLAIIMGCTPVKVGAFTAPGLEKNLLPVSEYQDLYNHPWVSGNNYIPDEKDADPVGALLGGVVDGCAQQ